MSHIGPSHKFEKLKYANLAQWTKMIVRNMESLLKNKTNHNLRQGKVVSSPTLIL